MSGPKPKRPMPKREETDDSARAAKAAAILGGIFTVAALALFGPRAALSVLLGAGIGVANLMTMRAIIRAVIRAPEDETKPDEARAGAGEPESESADEPTPDHAGQGRRGGVAWGVFAVLKILVLFGGVWILLTRGLVDPMALVVGYGVLPLGIAASSLWSNLGPRR
jgi:hypothetical protein